MYDKEDAHHFYGSHASRAKDLKDQGYFNRSVDLLTVAPIVGFNYGVVAERNNDNDITEAMFKNQLMKVDPLLELNYKTIMLLDKEYEPNEENRINKAFQVSPDKRDPRDLEHYESYVRGGIDVLYEHLIGEGNTPSDRLIDLYEFIYNFADEHYDIVVNES